LQPPVGWILKLNSKEYIGNGAWDARGIFPKEEACQQVGQSASLFKAILEYVAGSSKPEK
jgi:hypothetical protein